MVAENIKTAEDARRVAHDMLEIPEIRDVAGEYIDLRNRYESEIYRAFEVTQFGKTPDIKQVVDRFEPRLKMLDDKVSSLIEEHLDG